MRAMILFVAWCVWFVRSWPLALLALARAPVVWLVWLFRPPFRFSGLALDATFALAKSVLFLPAPVLGWRPA